MMKRIAPTNGWPTRDTALLIADPRPAFRVGIEPISVLVNGATTNAIPSPNRMVAGSTSMNTDGGGTSVAGSSNDASHGCEVGGILAHQSIAADMISGPATRNGFALPRPAAAPIRVDSDTSMIPVGSPISAAAVAV